MKNEVPLHDLDLPLIGPYSRRFLGAARVLDRQKGSLAVFPLGLSLDGANKINWIPGSEGEEKWYMTDAAEDLSAFSLRYLLKGKDQVLADAAYRVLDDFRFVCKIVIKNQTDTVQKATIQTAVLHEWEPPALAFSFPKDSVVIDAAHYSKISAYHQYALDGQPICVRNALFSRSGRVLGGHFGEWPGDKVEYDFETEQKIPNAHIVIRYAKRYDNVQQYRLILDGRPVEVAFGKTTDFNNGLRSWKHVVASLGDVNPGRHSLVLETAHPQNRFLEKDYERNLYSEPSGKDAEKATAFALDFFCLTSDASNPAQWIRRTPFGENPVRMIPSGSHFLLHDHLFSGPNWFAFGFPDGSAAVTEHHERLAFKEYPDNHNILVFPADQATPPEDSLFVHGARLEKSVEVPPKGKKEISILGVCASTREEAERAWDELKPASSELEFSNKKYLESDFQIRDEAYGPSVAHEVAYLLGNVSFPNNVGGRNVFTNCADRFRFHMLYSWDAGMIAVGQAQCSLRRSEENIRQYLLVDDANEPLLQHGTILPTQIYAMWELFQRTGDKGILSRLYSAARKAYLFYVGRNPKSSLLRNNNDFINASNIFYNAIGMDDYPVQLYCAEQNLLSHVEMPETNASAIRFGRILEMCAGLLGFNEHIPEYQADRKRFWSALETLWDNESGYYWWRVGKELLRSSDGENFNKGISGVYPIVTNMVDASRRTKVIANIRTPGKLWSPIGISTVDQSAPYYSPNGYWNGRVWMPHQWILWKTMLDIGETEFAEKIAYTALEIWARNESKGGMCYENFRIDTGEGGGACHFTALSSVVVNFYCGYYRPESVSTGFDVFVTSREIMANGEGARIAFSSPLTGSHRTGAVIVLLPDTDYQVEEKTIRSGPSGALSFIFEIDKAKRVEIRKRS